LTLNKRNHQFPGQNRWLILFFLISYHIVPILYSKTINMLPEGLLYHKPKSIVAAKNMLYASLFLGIIIWAIRRWTNDLHTRPSRQETIVLVVSLLVVFILIKQIGLGRKWARVVLLVLSVPGILVYPWTFSAFFKESLLVGVINLLQALLQIVALVFLFSKESTQWFNDL